MRQRCGLNLLLVLLISLVVLVVVDIACMAILTHSDRVMPEILVTGFVSAVLTLCDLGAILYVSLVARDKGEI